MEQLLLVTSCDLSSGIGASLRTADGRTTDGWTDRRDVGNSILDVHQMKAENILNSNLTSKNTICYKKKS